MLNDALRNIFGFPNKPAVAPVLLTDDGDIVFSAILEQIRSRVGNINQEDESAAVHTPSTSGRIGPVSVALDETSATGDFRIDGFLIESLSNFSSARATTAVFKGKWMYEVILATSGIQQIGWATIDTPFTAEEGVGDAPNSYAWDGKRVQRWNVSHHSYGSAWSAGDIIGVCVDMEAGTMRFIKNGVDLGEAFNNVRHLQPGAAFFPAISISHGEQCEVNFGGRPLRYPIEGYAPMQDPPPLERQHAVEYLLSAFQRLVVRHLLWDSLAAVPVKAAAIAGDVEMVDAAPPAGAPWHTFSQEDLVLLGGAIMQHLAPLLCGPSPAHTNSYMLSAYFMPFLQEQRELGNNGAGLRRSADLLNAVLEQGEAAHVWAAVFVDLARSVRTEQLQPHLSPLAGPFPALALAAALLRCPSARVHLLADDHVMEHVEALLTRKSLTARDLKEILPTVWWPAASTTNDPRISEAGHEAGVKALSVALAVTEQQQFAVCEALALAPRELLLEDGMYSGTDSDEEGPVPADGDEAMAGSATPTRAEGVSPANTTSATPAEQESATAREAAAQQLAAGRSSTRGGMVLGDDSGRTVLSAFLEHLVTKNSGATRSVQEVGLSDPTVLVTTYYALLHLLRPHLEVTCGEGTAGRQLSSFPAADSFLQGLEFGRESEADRYGDMARLGGTCGHLLREFPPAGLDHSPVPVLLVESTTASEHSSPSIPLSGGELAGMVDCAMLLYHLGLAPVLKNAQYQAQSQEQSALQLADVDRRLASAGPADVDHARHLREAQHVLRDDIVDSTRFATWNREWLFVKWKQDTIFSLVVYVVRMLLGVSARGVLFSYVPEFYVDVLLDACGALRQASISYGSKIHSVLLGPGLGDLVHFLCALFHDSRIINPDIREALLKAIAAMMQYPAYVREFEQSEVARQVLMQALMGAFDQRTWVQVSGILVLITYGRGFGQGTQGRAAKLTACSSAIFSQRLTEACQAEPEIFSQFINRLFNTLNWTATELTTSLKELSDQHSQHGRVEATSQRRCTLMFDRSVDLARILEVLALQLPASFLRGSSLNLTRLVEVLSFILSHTTNGAGGAMLDAALRLDLPLLNKLSGPTLLAPIIGMLTTLTEWEERNAASALEQSMTLVEALAAQETCPLQALDYAAALDWQPLKADGDKVDMARVQSFQAFVVAVKSRRAADVATAASELEADGEVPDEFLDPLLQTVMRDPVILPDSHITIDRSTIERHLLSSKTDPFNRSPLTLEALKTDDALKARIQSWQQHRKQQL